MKKLLLSFICLLFLNNVKAQDVTIPDAKFVAWLQANVASAMVGNQMDTTNVAVTLRTSINVENDSIGDLTGVQYFDSLKTLDCGNGFNILTPNFLTSLPRLPTSLEVLKCGNNSLAGLPPLPTSLKILDCYYNQITSLPALPNSLLYLDCSYDWLPSLPTLPPLLLHLSCGSNFISTFPTLPNGLNYFECQNMQLTVLPNLPNLIDTIYCGYNNLTSLPTLPTSLVILFCEYNQLITLPPLPGLLSSLFCHDNSLVSLPPLPSSLSNFWCANNSLVTVPSLPAGLIYFGCEVNQIVTLPPLPSSLLEMSCFNNQISALPSLPQNLYLLKCQNNNINCFPEFPNSIWNPSYFNISNNPFTCLPNYIPAMNAATLAYPLCAPGNTNSCASAQGIIGFTYEDKNSDCAKNAGDSSLKNIQLQIYDNTGVWLGQTISALNGVYDFPQILNTYTVVVDTVGAPYMAQCTFPGLDSTVTVNLIDTNINFSLTCKPGFDVGAQSLIMSDVFFPGVDNILNVVAGDMSHWYNLKCATGVSGQVQITITGNVTYVSPVAGALTPSVAGNIFTYLVSDFGLVNNSSDFNLLFNTSTNAQAGDTVCISIAVTPTSGDINPNNNTFSYCYVIQNSHDPNKKEVYPVDVAPNYNGWFTYVIHFQNTGTAAAMNIHLADTLDNNLDLTTFQILNYSHPNTSYVNGNVLAFSFPNINLADSGSSFNASQGYVQYRVKPKPNLPGGTQIKNTANIYFDFNPAVVTNTTINNFIAGIGIKEEIVSPQIKIYPNAASTEFAILFPKGIKNAKILLYSVEGSLLLEKNTSSEAETVDVSSLAKGIYFVKVESGQKTYMSKLIKN